LYVGGIFQRAETLTTGEALVGALKSEGCATEGGQVIVAESCFRYVDDSLFRATELTNAAGEKFYKLDLKYRG
jgi:hypothetical protein